MREVGDWEAIARRNARSVQTTVGWVFWDPDAVAQYERLGRPRAARVHRRRCAPLAPAGPEAVIAALASISPAGIRLTFEMVASSITFDDV